MGPLSINLPGRPSRPWRGTKIFRAIMVISLHCGRN